MHSFQEIGAGVVRFPQTLTLILTSKCTAACSHCCMNSGPTRAERVSPDTVEKTIRKLHASNPLSVVVFAGGEPTLAKKALEVGIKICDELGIGSRLVTNASWATSYEQAKKMLKKLRDIGLNEINISADDYHLPFVSFENVSHAWRASKGMGFTSVIIANPSSPHSMITPDFIMKKLGEDIPLRFNVDGAEGIGDTPAEDGTFYGLSNTTYQKLERARYEVPEHDFLKLDTMELLEGPCPHAISGASLTPKGKLVACCGFEVEDNEVLDFGNANKEDVIDLISQANQDPIVRGISFLGPAYLQNVVKEVAPEIQLPEDCSSVCEICNNIVKSPEIIRVLRENIDKYLPAANAIAGHQRKARNAAR